MSARWCWTNLRPGGRQFQVRTNPAPRSSKAGWASAAPRGAGQAAELHERLRRPGRRPWRSFTTSTRTMSLPSTTKSTFPSTPSKSRSAAAKAATTGCATSPRPWHQGLLPRAGGRGAAAGPDGHRRLRAARTLPARRRRNCRSCLTPRRTPSKLLVRDGLLAAQQKFHPAKAPCTAPARPFPGRFSFPSIPLSRYDLLYSHVGG